MPAEDGDSGQTAGDKPEEGGDDVKSSCPMALGYTRTTMADTENEPARGSEPQKVRLSSDRSLQPDSVKPESLVIADQHAAVKTLSALYTPPVKPWESAMPEAGGRTRREGAVEGRADDGVKS